MKKAHLKRLRKIDFYGIFLILEEGAISKHEDICFLSIISALDN